MVNWLLFAAALVIVSFLVLWFFVLTGSGYLAALLGAVIVIGIVWMTTITYSE